MVWLFLTGGGGGVPTNPGGGGGAQQGINSDDLSATDKSNLNNTINEAKANCVYRALLDWLQNNGNVNIKISEDVDMAVYYANTKEIKYKEGWLLAYTELLTHEGFHAYQHQKSYGVIFGSYSLRNPGNINIEFEQIVFQDIAKRVKEGTAGIGDMFNQSQKQGFQQAQSDYINWINNLTSNGTSYPNLSNMLGFEAEFNQHLSNFKEFGHTGYTGTAIVPNIGTSALKSLFNGSIGTNCEN